MSSYQYIYKNPKAPRSDLDDEIEIKLPFLDSAKRPYHQYEQAFAIKQVHFYISKPVGAADDYVDMIHYIATAGEHETIYIHLNTPGGHLDTGVQLINAMRNSPARIVTMLEGQAFSLGTLILLAGDEIIINDNCMMMFHNFSSGLIGKGNEMLAELNASVEWVDTLARDIYIPFLSEEEYDRIRSGEDKWMQSGEIKKRLVKMMKTLEKQQKQAAEKPKAKKHAKAGAVALEEGEAG